MNEHPGVRVAIFRSSLNLTFLITLGVYLILWEGRRSEGKAGREMNPAMLLICLGFTKMTDAKLLERNMPHKY
jgi:hypothetical protein